MNVWDFDTDAVVVGAGPAGLALVHELLARGIDTLCVAPELRPWAPNYGAWADELVGLDVPVSNSWSRARVSFPAGDFVDLDRRYVKLDSTALYENWSRDLIDHDRFVCGVVSSALFSGDFHEIRLGSGQSIRARQVFDASGHEPRIVSRDPTSPAVQTAYGAVVTSSAHTMSHDTMGLMLWDDGLKLNGRGQSIPAFYYVMPVGGEKQFDEYTVLAQRPFVSLDALRERFTADHVSDAVAEGTSERCFIPMGYPVPALDQLQVGFGGAASMVHPATGYMVARTLRAAPAMAEAYEAVRAEPGAARARALWRVIWPEEQCRSHELYRFGLEAILGMDVEETHAFFAAFFGLPDELWRPYQSGVARPKEIAAAMWAVFRAVGPGLKLKLARAGFGPHSGKLSRLIR